MTRSKELGTKEDVVNNAARLSNEPDDIKSLYASIKQAANDIMVTGERGDIARGVVVTATILLGRADADFRTQIVGRSRALLTTRTDANANEVDAAKAYFADMLGAPERVNAKEEPDRMQRDRHNNRVAALMQQAGYIAKCVIAVDHTKTWNEFSPPKVKANKGSIRLSLNGAAAIWPDRKRSLDAMEETVIVLSNRAGAWRLSSLAEAGTTIARHAGLLKPQAERAKPVLDIARSMKSAAEANDVKTLNTSPETQLAAFEALVSIVDMLNDKTFVRQLDSKIVAPFRAHVEAKMIEVTEAMRKSAPVNGEQVAA